MRARERRDGFSVPPPWLTEDPDDQRLDVTSSPAAQSAQSAPVEPPMRDGTGNEAVWRPL